MNVALISHNNDGIRVNIDGVVDVFSNSVLLAESYARHKMSCQQQESAVRPLAERVAKAYQRDDFDHCDPKHSAELRDASVKLIEALIPFLEHCRR